MSYHAHYVPGEHADGTGTYYCDLCQDAGGSFFCDENADMRHHLKTVHEVKRCYIKDADKDPRERKKKRAKEPPKTPEPYQMTEEERTTAMTILENPDWLKTVWERMDQHIVKDYSARRILFKAMVSAFALKDPLNVILKGDWSTGKSFLAKQVGRYIPPEYIRFIEGASPKSMYYDYGVKSEDGLYKIIDLSNKVWVFLDIKDTRMIDFLRSMMSHDSYEREYHYVDDLKTHKTVLRGFPAVIICTANPKWEEEYSSRAITMSPEIDQDKFKGAILMDSRRVASPDFKPTTSDIHAVLRLLAETTRQPRFPDAAKYAEQLLEDIEQKRQFRSRDMRDLKWLPRLALITAWLHQRHRITEDEYIDVEDHDYQVACEDWAPVHETTTTGLTTVQLQFLREAYNGIDPGMGITMRDIINRYYDIFGQHRSRQTITERILEPLETYGYLESYQDPNDRRRNLWVRTQLPLIFTNFRHINQTVEIRRKTEPTHLTSRFQNSTHSDALNNMSKIPPEESNLTTTPPDQRERLTTLLFFIDELTQKHPKGYAEHVHLKQCLNDFGWVNYTNSDLDADLEHLKNKEKCILQLRPGVYQRVNPP